jgi:hypothetical protein
MFEKIEDPKQKALLNRINGIGLAAFLVMIGILWLIPKGTFPETSWLIGLGIIMIGGNVARYLNGIRLCHCTGVLGVILLLAGVCGLFGVKFPIFPVLAILAGIGIVIGIVSKKKCCQGNETATEDGNQKSETNTET